MFLKSTLTKLYENGMMLQKCLGCYSAVWPQKNVIYKSLWGKVMKTKGENDKRKRVVVTDKGC